MTVQAFSDYLGVSKSTLEGYEYGYRNPSKAFISLVCNRMNIREEWLRTGEGPRFIERDQSRESIVYEAIKKARPDMPDSFPKGIAGAMAKLSSEDWMFLARLAQDMAKRAKELEKEKEAEKQNADNLIYSETAAKNARPTPFVVQAGRDIELFRQACDLAKDDEDELD